MIADGALALAVIAAFLLVGSGARSIIRGGDRKRAALMIAAAAVLIGNVVVMTV